MKKEQPAAQCPFLGEIVMDYCEAYPVRKPIPKHQINTPTPCTSESHKGCPAFVELMARIRECAAASRPAARRAVNPVRR